MCGKKIAALTLVAASADMRDLGAVFDHEEPLLHPTCDCAQQNMRDEGDEASPVLRFIVAGCAPRLDRMCCTCHRNSRRRSPRSARRNKAAGLETGGL
jgi:hypothetical protein